jgi:hypothetical protein
VIFPQEELASSKAKSLKLDHGLSVFEIGRCFPIRGKAHGHKSSDRRYPLLPTWVRQMPALRNRKERPTANHHQ